MPHTSPSFSQRIVYHASFPLTVSDFAATFRREETRHLEHLAENGRLAVIVMHHCVSACLVLPCRTDMGQLTKPSSVPPPLRNHAIHPFLVCSVLYRKSIVMPQTFPSFRGGKPESTLKPAPSSSFPSSASPG